MKIAVLYQKCALPAVNGILKPMKPGGYSDSGADIAYCLFKNGIDVALPVNKTDVNNDYDWVFPDTKEGIEAAVSMGADTFWLNTMLYDGHPVEDFQGFYAIGQSPADAFEYDDKFYTNTALKNAGFPVVAQRIADENYAHSDDFPCIVKPIRGRGSQGVVRCACEAELRKAVLDEIASKKYGKRLIVEEYLPGNEITVAVFPNGKALPAVERYNHNNGIAPYNGDVPVEANSRAVSIVTLQLEKITKACEDAVKFLGIKGLVRIDCRADASGDYKIFDFNMKPNMTAGGRPGRESQNSLVMIAAQKLGMTYFDLLSRMIEFRWQID